MGKKAKLIELLSQVWEEQAFFVAGLTDSQRLAQGSLEHWSAKDVIAHIAAWNDRMAQMLEGLSAGLPPSPVGDIDQVNAEIYRAHCNDSWGDVLHCAEVAHRRLMEQVSALDEETLCDDNRFTWLNGQPLWRRVVMEYLHPLMHFAGYYTKHGAGQRALAVWEQAAARLEPLDASPAWQGTNRYNLACGYALAGQKEKALETLREALQLNPDLIAWSKEDPDLTALRGDPAYRALYQS